MAVNSGGLGLSLPPNGGTSVACHSSDDYSTGAAVFLSLQLERPKAPTHQGRIFHIFKTLYLSHLDVSLSLAWTNFLEFAVILEHAPHFGESFRLTGRLRRLCSDLRDRTSGLH